MSRHALAALGLALALSVPPPASADYLVVRHPAKLKPEAGSELAPLEALEEGDHLALLSPVQERGYYHVRSLSSGLEGWVYRTLARRYPGTSPLAAALSPSRAPEAAPPSVSRHLTAGTPDAFQLRVHDGYVIGHDSRLKIPLWVQYELRPEDLTDSRERSEDFRPDPSLPSGQRAELADYRGSGFDRGHMAPAADMVATESLMSDSFLLSNMAPQVGIGFNRHIWKSLETAVRGWVRHRGPLVVVTGPVFAPTEDEVCYRIIGDNRVAVPSAFYKVVADLRDPDDPAVLAFLLPNTGLSGREFDEFLTSVDAIEAATGIDLLSALDDDIEDAVEAIVPTGVW